MLRSALFKVSSVCANHTFHTVWTRGELRQGGILISHTAPFACCPRFQACHLLSEWMQMRVPCSSQVVPVFKTPIYAFFASEKSHDSLIVDACKLSIVCCCCVTHTIASDRQQSHASSLANHRICMAWQSRSCCHS